MTELLRAWIQHPTSEEWVVGEVLHRDEGAVCVRLECDTKLTVSPSSLMLCNPAHEEGVEDMIRLQHLHPPGLLHNLRVRYKNEDIYTYTGRMLISVNPFKWLPLYEPAFIDRYHSGNVEELPPHVYATAERAVDAVRRTCRSQSVLVSGESGAGKTEATKIIVRYIMVSVDDPSADAGVANDRSDVAPSATMGNRLASLLLKSNPLLEAFGNAKTLRNNNSSRFGKFLEIVLQRPLQLLGARTSTYLLEKSRVVSQTTGERNYHIFYQLLAGLPEETMHEFHLRRHDSQGSGGHAYTTGGSCTTIADVDDVADFHMTCQSLAAVGVSNDMQLEIWSALASVLHLGDCQFDVEGDDGCKIISSDSFTTSARLLGCSADSLRKVITSRSLITREGTLLRPQTVDQAKSTRDALAKGIYGNLFEWLVRKINSSMEPGFEPRDVAFIGLLDIFGFESFEHNSFEQLCINYANEKLQQQFTKDVFKNVQDEYQDEGIEWSRVDFIDNAECLALLESKLGVLSLLDEECVLPKGNDAQFVDKLFTLHADHAYFHKPKRAGARAVFGVVHYAGTVLYSSEGFLNKNRDTLHDDVKNLLRNECSKFIQSIFTPPSFNQEASLAKTQKVGAGARSKLSTPTVGMQFKGQLGSLMRTLATTDVQYVRCVKPNDNAQPMVFDAAKISEQLRYCGVLEVVRISRLAYPHRLIHADFAQRYKGILSSFCTCPEDGQEVVKHLGSIPAAAFDKAKCDALAYALLGDRHAFQTGRTRVYLRSGALDGLEVQRAQVHGKAAVSVQRHVRGFLRRRWFARVLSALVCIQAFVRMTLCRKQYQRILKSVVSIQCCVRRWMAVRLAFRLRRQKCATRIQATWRMAHARKRYVCLRCNAVRIQCTVRMWSARKKFLIAREEFREQLKLENQVAALRRRLEEEVARSKQLEERLKHVPSPGSHVAQYIKDTTLVSDSQVAVPRRLGVSSTPNTTEGKASNDGDNFVAVPHDVTENIAGRSVREAEAREETSGAAGDTSGVAGQCLFGGDAPRVQGGSDGAAVDGTHAPGAPGPGITDPVGTAPAALTASVDPAEVLSGKPDGRDTGNARDRVLEAVENGATDAGLAVVQDPRDVYRSAGEASEMIAAITALQTQLKTANRKVTDTRRQMSVMEDMVRGLNDEAGRYKVKYEVEMRQHRETQRKLDVASDELRKVKEQGDAAVVKCIAQSSQLMCVMEDHQQLLRKYEETRDDLVEVKRKLQQEMVAHTELNVVVDQLRRAVAGKTNSPYTAEVPTAGSSPRHSPHQSPRDPGAAGSGGLPVATVIKESQRGGKRSISVPAAGGDGRARAHGSKHAKSSWVSWMWSS